MKNITQTIFAASICLALSGCSLFESPKDKGEVALTERKVRQGVMNTQEAEKFAHINQSVSKTNALSAEDAAFLLSLCHLNDSAMDTKDPEYLMNLYVDVAVTFGIANSIPPTVKDGVFMLARKMVRVNDKRSLCKTGGIDLFKRLDDKRAIPYLKPLLSDTSKKSEIVKRHAREAIAQLQK